MAENYASVIAATLNVAFFFYAWTKQERVSALSAAVLAFCWLLTELLRLGVLHG